MMAERLVDVVNTELESRIARVSIGVLPVSSVPRDVKLELLSWDHERFPDFFWKIPDISVLDIRFHNLQSLEGFKIREFEEVVVVVGERPFVIIPSGEWLLKGCIGFDGEAKKMGLVWVDMRPFKTSHRISVSTDGGRIVEVDCGVQFRATDAIVLVRNLILGYDVVWKDLDQMVHGILEEVIVSEMDKGKTLDLTVGTETLKAALTHQMSYWGMEAMSVRLSNCSAPAVNDVRSQPHPTFRHAMNDAMEEGEKVLLANWDVAPKRWVPQSRKGEVKCDGCGDDCDMYAQCEVVCRASTRCRLCRECYPRRVRCAFLPTKRTLELEDIELQR